MGSSLTTSIWPLHLLPSATRLMMFLECWQLGSDLGGDVAWRWDTWGFPTCFPHGHSSTSLGLAAGGSMGPTKIEDLGIPRSGQSNLALTFLCPEKHLPGGGEGNREGILL